MYPRMKIPGPIVERRSRTLFFNLSCSPWSFISLLSWPPTTLPLAQPWLVLISSAPFETWVKAQCASGRIHFTRADLAYCVDRPGEILAKSNLVRHHPDCPEDRKADLAGFPLAFSQSQQMGCHGAKSLRLNGSNEYPAGASRWQRRSKGKSGRRLRTAIMSYAGGMEKPAAHNERALKPWALAVWRTSWKKPAGWARQIS